MSEWVHAACGHLQPYCSRPEIGVVSRPTRARDGWTTATGLNHQLTYQRIGGPETVKYSAEVH